MDPRVDEILKKIEKFEETGSLGSVPRASGEFLRLMVLATKSRKVLELGCSAGYECVSCDSGYLWNGVDCAASATCSSVGGDGCSSSVGSGETQLGSSGALVAQAERSRVIDSRYRNLLFMTRYFLPRHSPGYAPLLLPDIKLDPLDSTAH